MQKTKIIATLGPACRDLKIIKNMIKSGLSVFRINTSHLKQASEVKSIIRMIRRESKKLDRSISVMMDLGGPKIRVKLLPNTQPIIIKTIEILDCQDPCLGASRGSSVAPPNVIFKETQLKPTSVKRDNQR